MTMDNCPRRGRYVKGPSLARGRRNRFAGRPAGTRQAALNAGANASATHFSIEVGVVVAAERGCVGFRWPSLNPFDIST